MPTMDSQRGDAAVVARERVSEPAWHASSFSAAPPKRGVLARASRRAARDSTVRCRWPAAPPRPRRQPVPVAQSAASAAREGSPLISRASASTLWSTPPILTRRRFPPMPRSRGARRRRAAAARCGRAALDAGRRRPLDRGRRRSRGGRARSAKRRDASSSRSAAMSSRRFERCAAASLSHPQRRSGRSAVAGCRMRAMSPARGPFAEADDARCMRERHASTWSSPRTAAARRRTARSPPRARSAFAVIMLRRPPAPRDVPTRRRPRGRGGVARSRASPRSWRAACRPAARARRAR